MTVIARDSKNKPNLLYGGEASLIQSSQCQDNFFEHRTAYGADVGGRGRGTQISEAYGRLRVVYVETNSCNETKGGGAAAVHGRGRRRNATALNQHTTYFHREGAQDVDVVGPFDAENVAKPR